MEINKIYNMDCLQGMKDIPDGSIDMILCDLPYGVTRNSWDSMVPLEDLWRQYKRIIKDNGAICLHADGMFMAMLMMSQPKLWRYNLVWDKVLTSGFLNANRMPLRRTEEICVFYKKQPTYNPQKSVGSRNHGKGKIVGKLVDGTNTSNNNYGNYVAVDNSAESGTQKHPTSLLRFQKTHPSKALHPTEKPVSLCEYLIKTYTNPGELVLDNCIGSGTTSVAAIRTGRNFIGFEITEDYCRIANQRNAEAYKTLNSKPIKEDYIKC